MLIVAGKHLKENGEKQILPTHKSPMFADNSNVKNASSGGIRNMKATGIVRRIDDLGRVVIPKEIRRTLRIREGDPSQTTLTPQQTFCFAMLDFSKRTGNAT